MAGTTRKKMPKVGSNIPKDAARAAELLSQFGEDKHKSPLLIINGHAIPHHSVNMRHERSSFGAAFDTEFNFKLYDDGGLRWQDDTEFKVLMAGRSYICHLVSSEITYDGRFYQIELQLRAAPRMPW